MTDQHETVDTDQIAAFMEENAPAAPEPAPTPWAPDYTSLNKANGDPAIWAHHVSELIGHTTGSWISEETLETWMAAFHDQVRARANQAAVLQVSNFPIQPATSGNPVLVQLELRGQIADTFKPGAGF